MLVLVGAVTLAYLSVIESIAATQSAIMAGRRPLEPTPVVVAHPR
jgi:NADH:ubiquinone oxidoreductase subunit 6 (subunit J)